jgi:hypothetical protein
LAVRAGIGFLKIVLLACVAPVAVAAVHSVPKDRADLTAPDWFPYVISKVAPLEWWSFAASPSDLRREDYPSDFLFQFTQQNTWEFPRFCFELFRPKPDDFAALFAAVEEYQGDVTWTMYDHCIAAFPGKPGKPVFITALPKAEDLKKLEQLLRNPPSADPEFVKRAIADIPRFCDYLEKRLGLIEKPAQDFDPRWLTREGLLASRGQFEDYLEPGSWAVFLARRPGEYAKGSRPTSDADRDLGMGIGADANGELLKELGANWEQYDNNGRKGPLVHEFPLMSRLNDESEDTVYEPREVAALLAEYWRAQAIVKTPSAIRGLDNLIRIARWAQKLKLGIYFSGE